MTLPCFVIFDSIAWLEYLIPYDRAPFTLPNQRPVHQSLPLHALDQRLQPVNGIDPAVAFIQPEHELVNVLACVLPAEAMISAVKAPFQHRPDAFNAVCVRHPVNKLLGRVFDGLVGIRDVQAFVYLMFISTNCRAEGDLGLDDRLQRGGVKRA